MNMTQPSIHEGRSVAPRSIAARLTVRTLAALLDKAAIEAFSEVVGSRYGLVQAKGRILRLPETRYSRLYDVALEADGATVYLEIPTALADERNLAAGDYVSITGRLIVNAKWEGVVKMRVEVCQLELTDSPEEIERKRSEATALQRVRDLRSKRVPFPFKPELTVTVICGAQSQVIADFLGTIAAVSAMLRISEVNVPMDSSFEIASAIERAEADILVVIRGGGSAEGFAVFDDKRVAEALGKTKAFRIVGLGHASNSGVLDLIADHASNTPADAGTFIAQQLGSFFSLRDLATKEIERLQREQVQALDAGRRRDELLGRLRAENDAGKVKVGNQEARIKKLQWLTAILIALIVLKYLFKV